MAFPVSVCCERGTLRGLRGGISIDCMLSRGRAKGLAIRIVSDEYLDLYLLAGPALAFTVLGFVGVVSIGVLASATLALLAVLAYSQIRSRRYYAGRSADSTRERVRQTLRFLAELKPTTGGDLSVRLTPHPLAMGVIAIDGSPDRHSDVSAVFAEYYTYQAPGEPKFTLQPSDTRWFESLHREAEALWAAATEHGLAS